MIGRVPDRPAYRTGVSARPPAGERGRGPRRAAAAFAAFALATGAGGSLRAEPSPGNAPAASLRVDGGHELPTLRPLFLSLFDVVSTSSQPVHPSARLRVTLQLGDDATDLGELTKRLGRKIAPDHTLVLDSLGYPPSRDRPAGKDRRSTFLVDYDEPSVRAVRKEVATRYASPSMKQLAAFVDEFITKKDMARAYDVASVVASRREGDCTEHAVLLAALGRAFGHTTRVVDGLVLITIEGKTRALGHSWVEYHDDKSWEVADAAIPAAIDPVYLPLFVVADEGPGYGSAGNGALLAVRRVLVEDAPPAVKQSTR